MRRFIFIFGLLLVSGGAHLTLASRDIPEVSRFVSQSEEKILFVGDVLLARDVERQMERRGHDYPFHRISSFLREHTHVIGNFEASVPEIHKPTPDFTTRFSVSSEYLPSLRDAGFFALSLANNHSFDFGNEGYVHTQHTLERVGIGAFGAPHTLSEEDVLFETINGVEVGIVPLTTIGGSVSEEDLLETLSYAAQKSDIQIVYVHWGEEYESFWSSKQEQLAHRLVDNGADVIIGHHPHVVQGIEVYKGAPIFYSLGNFVFDQYEESTLQEGLMVTVAPGEETLLISFLPVTSRDSRAAPRLMYEEEVEDFVDRLRGISHRSASELLYSGYLETSF